MERTRVTRSRTKQARLIQRAAAVSVATFLLGGFTLFLIRPASTEATADRSGVRIVDRTRVCMLQDTVQAQAGLEYEDHGKKYYLCCGGCLAAFKVGVEHYRTAVDPITGATVDKASAPIYAYRGHAYFFVSEEALATFARDPRQYVTAAVH